MAGGAKSTGLAGKSQKILSLTIGTTNPGKTAPGRKIHKTGQNEARGLKGPIPLDAFNNESESLAKNVNRLS